MGITGRTSANRLGATRPRSQFTTSDAHSATSTSVQMGMAYATFLSFPFSSSFIVSLTIPRTRQVATSISGPPLKPGVMFSDLSCQTVPISVAISEMTVTSGSTTSRPPCGKPIAVALRASSRSPSSRAKPSPPSRGRDESSRTHTSFVASKRRIVVGCRAASPLRKRTAGPVVDPSGGFVPSAKRTTCAHVTMNLVSPQRRNPAPRIVSSEETI